MILEILKFIFQDFYHWLGFCILVWPFVIFRFVGSIQ